MTTLTDALSKLSAVQERLAGTSTDPKWLNDDLSAIKALLETASAPEAHEMAMPPMMDVDFAAMASLSALQALLKDFVPMPMDVSPEAITAKKDEVDNLVIWATYSGLSLEKRRQVRMRQQARKAARQEAAAETEASEQPTSA